MSTPKKLQHIKTVVIANRGEIAVRCIKACRELSLRSVAIFTNADATSLHVSLADEAHLLPGPDSSAYVDDEAVLQICKLCHADAVIPGYGFLSENTEFAVKVQQAGMVFVGPSVKSIRAMGLKHEARDVAVAAQVPIISGSPLLLSVEQALEHATNIGYPVMLKATGGGGGMGLQVCYTVDEVENAFNLVVNRAGILFKNTGVFMERFYPHCRHIEVQVLGNGETVVAFGERECSLQRRHQKVIEECPSPYVEERPGLREKIVQSAIRYASQLNYRSVGTVEFLVDDETSAHFFLEMNTRLQVEHGITEACYGVDLVHLMLWQADCERADGTGIPTDLLLGLTRSAPVGAAIEARIYAEVPFRNFAPSPGLLQNVQWPNSNNVRVDTWVRSGQKITPHYDPLIAKLIVYSAAGRMEARSAMLNAMAEARIQGTPTNLDYCAEIIKSDAFRTGNTLTSTLSTFVYKPQVIEVIKPGLLTTVQDYPGRFGLGHGIPRSGPLDDVSARVANVLVGNRQGLELLEVTLTGPELLFHAAAVVAVCGAETEVTIDGHVQPMWARLVINKGQILKIGDASRCGLRSYIAIKGGLPGVPLYLGSKSTVPEAGLGGTQGRGLRPNDLLELAPETAQWATTSQPFVLDAQYRPQMTHKQILYCMEGPHDSPDFLTAEDHHLLYSAEWETGHNSNRTGVRLIGPSLNWARPGGGAGGSHPSNLVEYGYPSFGGLNWTGDECFIFSADGPDLGGFLCTTTICSGDMWKVGQLRPGDKLCFRRTTWDAALKLHQIKDLYIEAIANLARGESVDIPPLHIDLGTERTSAILKRVERVDGRPCVTYRQGGDRFIIVKYGEEAVDLRNTARVQLLEQAVQKRDLDGIVLHSNVGTLTCHYEPTKLNQQDLLALLLELDDGIPGITDIGIPCREILLPACMDHPILREAHERYMQTIRPTASYLPDNLEYLKQNNVLQSRREAFEALLKTDYLVVGVGFIVGTAIMWPLDPQYMLSSQKYNPTRTWTPGGTIGIGGSMVGLYPIANPGGYQIMGRTLETWNTAGIGPSFSPSRPWLFEPFDIVKYFEVSIEEYDELEKQFFAGRYEFGIRQTTFNPTHFHELAAAATKDPAWVERQDRRRIAAQAMMENEALLVAQWKRDTASKSMNSSSYLADQNYSEADVLIRAPASSSVWKMLVAEGDQVKDKQVVAILEAMKMEISVEVPIGRNGVRITKILTPPGTLVSPGQALILAS